LGGIPYKPTLRTLLLNATLGDAVLRDEVFVSAQTMRFVEDPLNAVPDASSPAFELRRYSVPPAFSSNEVVPGDCAGQTVKPGCVEPASLGWWTMPDVSMCCIVTLAAPAASCAFEKA